LPFPQALQETLVSRLEEIRRLPETDSLGVREALSRRYGLSPAHFLVGGGTTEWIYTLPRVLKPRKVVVPLPTYADYADAAGLAGCPVETIGPWAEGEGASGADLVDPLRHAATDGSLVCLCNPNNPTGRFFPPDVLAAVIGDRPGAAWMVDETYAPFVAEDAESSLLARRLPPNLVVLRSFSKIYAIPGLRLGYAAGAPDMIGLLARVARPWSVNRLAQLAGEFLLAHPGHEERVREYCRKEKRRFLESIGRCAFLRAVPSACHFILFQVSRPWSAAALAAALRREGMLIRDCGNFAGLDGEYVRMSLGTGSNNDILISILEKFSSQGEVTMVSERVPPAG